MSVRIFWAVASGFLAGVFSRSFFELGWAEVGFLVLLAIALIAVAWVRKDTPAYIFVGALFFLACAVGIIRMHGAQMVPDMALSGRLGEKVVLEGRVFEEPDVRESNTRLSVRSDTGAGILVIAPLHVAVSYGDVVRVEGVLRVPEVFGAGEGREFDYPSFLAKDGIRYELSFAQVEKIGEGKKNLLKAGAIWIKQNYLEGLAFALPEPHAGLAGGITAGDKRGLGSELSETFRIVGLMHIVVLSGYNIMVVIGFMEWAFRRAPALLRFGLGVGVAIFFALMTGLASSSVRAAGMALIAMTGKLLPGRVFIAHRALAFVATGMVLWNPYVLAFDPGFQLSVVATWGMLSISPLIAARLSWFTEKFVLREIAATTIGTQLAVLPLLLYQSGQLSLVAFPTNLLALVVVPWAMLASFVAGVGGLIAGPLAPIVGFPAYVLLSYILFVAEWAARIPFATLAVGTFSVAVLVFTYVALIALVRIAAQR